jgi:thermitase
MHVIMYKDQLPVKLLLAILFTVLAWMPHTAMAAPIAQDVETTNERVRLMVKRDPAAQISVLSESSVAQGTLSQVGWEVIEVDANSAPQVMAELQANQAVVEVTPDYPLELAWNPDDPGFVEGTQWSLDKIGADIAWEFSAGQAITVAVIDSGIDANHPDLAGRIVPGHNFFDHSSDVTDLCGHGTHVAGIIAGAANNALGMAGVAHQAVIMPLKVIGNDCLGNYSRLMEAIVYAVDNGVRILSITSGGGFEHNGLHDAIKYAQSKGVLVVVAAGNRGDDLPFYPGSFSESFTIAGTDQGDNKYTNSNFGKQIDLSAPAVGIYSTYYTANDGSTYAYMTGTSMATPHVAAVAALILAVDPKLPLAELESALINSATDLGEPGWDPIFGWGRLTAWRAVAAVSPAAGNVRLGHYRIPKLAPFSGISIATTPDANKIQFDWTLNEFASDQTVVIYRTTVLAFDAAADIAEIATSATGSYIDTDIVADRSYFYWFVLADNDVEMAVTEAFSVEAVLTHQTPGQDYVALYIPMLQR